METKRKYPRACFGCKWLNKEKARCEHEGEIYDSFEDPSFCFTPK